MTEDFVRMGKRLVQLTLQPVGLTQVGVSSNPHIYHDLLYVVPRVRVSRRTLQCRVRHLTPTYVMTNELQMTEDLNVYKRMMH